MIYLSDIQAAFILLAGCLSLVVVGCVIIQGFRYVKGKM